MAARGRLGRALCARQRLNFHPVKGNFRNVLIPTAENQSSIAISKELAG